MVGIGSTEDEIVIHVRRPNHQTSRRPKQTAYGMNSTITDHKGQTEDAPCTFTTGEKRLRRVIALLPRAHVVVSSGFHSDMRERAMR
ncbi:hypothetical protein [Mycobacterium helveticum]|uniref:Uncharacterized protein n=1 Tax=Mycobacterium helveticum TaxID=2592811 RepID=A0A557XXT0_9MYCO|nr:hypothetical protein [Mycobacterium helveticum]TVS87003.1 hypothetical protein FPZ46_09880 [Mycobacterium helveticum]TVS90965.1 hypothetical protein FPZ47_06875 [Mycobacterium helveticum]